MYIKLYIHNNGCVSDPENKLFLEYPVKDIIEKWQSYCEVRLSTMHFAF